MTKRDTERHKETQRDKERHTEGHRETERHRETQRDTDRHRETHRDKERQRETHRNTQRHRYLQVKNRTLEIWLWRLLRQSHTPRNGRISLNTPPQSAANSCSRGAELNPRRRFFLSPGASAFYKASWSGTRILVFTRILV